MTDARPLQQDDDIAQWRVAASRAEVVEQLLALARQLQATEPARSRTLSLEARALAEAAGDRAGRSRAAYRLASIAYFTGAIDEAMAHALEARALADGCGELVVEAWALNLLGCIHVNAGNYSEALGLCLDALQLYRRTDHGVDEGNLLNAIAAIHQHLGDTERALRTYEQALEANEGADRPEHDALVIGNIAVLHTKRGDAAQAVATGHRAVALAEQHAPAYVPELLTTLAEAYDGAGAPDRALKLLDEAIVALAAAATEGREVAPTAEFNVLLSRGRVRLGAGEVLAAAEDLHAALARADAEGHRAGALEAHAALVEVYKAAGDPAQALVHAEARFAVNQELFNEGTDLRIRTLQIAHDTEHARQQAEIYRLRTTELETLVQHRTRDLEAFQLEALERLAVLGEFRDTDTGDHTVRVGDLAAELGRALELDAEWVGRLRLAARLHDIGKVAIPDSILLKPGPLTPAEFEVMKTHTTIGARILAGSTLPLVQMAEEVALNHHERFDGHGYPNGRSGTEIPLTGRIVTVADVFDALSSRRAYKPAWPVAEAIAFVRAASGSQFDPIVVAAFERVVAARYPALPLDLGAGATV